MTPAVLAEIERTAREIDESIEQIARALQLPAAAMAEGFRKELERLQQERGMH